MFVYLSYFIALRIGFQLPEYEYFEQDSQTLEHLVLIKENNRTSEQTFSVGVVFSDPGSELLPASLQQISNGTNFDYVLDIPGNCYRVLTFGPDQSEVNVSFSLLQDELPENMEGFRASISSEGSPFPIFQLPVTNTVSVPAFSTTLIRIQDNDCKYRKLNSHLHVHTHTHHTGRCL